MAVWQGASCCSIRSGQIPAKQYVRKDAVQSCIQYAERYAKDNKTEVSLANVEVELDAHYQRLYGTMKYKRGTEAQAGNGELTFSALSPDLSHKKTVTCYACGKEGHIKRDCPNNGSEGTTKTLCPSCKKKHKGGEEACFRNPKNAGEARKWRKKGNKPGAEVGGPAVAPEFGFPAASPHDDVPTLANPHLYLADSGASVDMVSSLAGAENIQSCDLQIRCANGMYEKAKRYGTIRKVYCSKKGKEMHVVLSDIHEVPSLLFNVISLTKRMRAGGRMVGDETGITVTSAEGATLKLRRAPGSRPSHHTSTR
jgi:hypothetical protein